jgi:mono/diheme cytochrome c family protein
MPSCRRRNIAGVGAALLIAGLGIAQQRPVDAPTPADAALIEQGRYFATAGDCISCHTRPHGAPFAGGVPLSTPFGIIYSANITPDAVSGIGAWSPEQFARAMREGIAPDGTHLYPAFPYPEFTQVSDADLRSI